MKKDGAKIIEYDAARMELESLREQLANLIELLHHQETVVGPNLRNAYMLAIGRLEFQAYELDMELRKWRRRHELRQAAINQGDVPDPTAIEAQIDSEMEEYAKRLVEWRQNCRNALASTQMDYMSSAQMANLRGMYLDAVKRLHPDLNPNLPPQAADLWNRMQKAYKDGNMREVEFLTTLVEDIVGSHRDFPRTAEGLTAMRLEYDRLKRQMRAVESEMENRKREKPLSYKFILEDDELVAQRQQEQKMRIETLTWQIRECEKEWRNVNGN